MLAAAPAWNCVMPSPDTGSVHRLATLPPPVTSSPSRIQVIPSAITTSQCHRVHGNRSILAGTRVSTAPLPLSHSNTQPLSPLCSVRGDFPSQKLSEKPHERA